MHRFARITLKIIFIIVFVSMIHEKGHASYLDGMDFEINHLYYRTSHFWNKNGKRCPSHNKFQLNQTNAYFWWSPNDCQMISIHANYDFIRERLYGNTVGFGDIEASWTHSLLNCEGLYCQLLTIIPTGKPKASLRYGKWALEGSLLYTFPFRLFGREGCGCGKLGYRGYAGFPSDQVRADVGFLWNIYSNFYLSGNGQLDYGVFNGKKKENFNVILFNPNYRLLKIKIELSTALTNCLFLNLGFYRHLWGENVGTDGGFIGGLYLSF